MTKKIIKIIPLNAVWLVVLLASCNKNTVYVWNMKDVIALGFLAVCTVLLLLLYAYVWIEDKIKQRRCNREEKGKLLRESVIISKELTGGNLTHTFDINGRRICVGDKVGYGFDDNTSFFIVVFEDNAFRKKYNDWDNAFEKPILDYGIIAEKMRLKVIC